MAATRLSTRIPPSLSAKVVLCGDGARWGASEARLSKVVLRRYADGAGCLTLLAAGLALAFEGAALLFPALARLQEHLHQRDGVAAVVAVEARVVARHVRVGRRDVPG